jgi:hypothetical protein
MLGADAVACKGLGGWKCKWWGGLTEAWPDASIRVGKLVNFIGRIEVVKSISKSVPYSSQGFCLYHSSPIHACWESASVSNELNVDNC